MPLNDLFRTVRAFRKPLMSTLSKSRNLQFPKEHKDWTVHDWKRVIRSDELCFQLHHSDGRISPAQSPNLNPIENLLDEIERGTRRLDPVPSNLPSLEIALHRIWSQIPHAIYQHVKASMPRRIHAILRKKVARYCIEGESHSLQRGLWALPIMFRYLDRQSWPVAIRKSATALSGGHFGI
ncbi:hypothetical protein TNCV_554841 [Trichonephila clavipes]|nr:hypothetical protein TNCV_554841 [Trichonephila clavipes]